MEVVVDANILFAAFIKDGITAQLLFSDKLICYVPSFVWEEFEKYSAYLALKTKGSTHDMERILTMLKGKLHIREPNQKYLSRIDPKDSVYLALAVEIDIPLWSNDKRLKEHSDVTILATKEIIKKLS